MIKRGEVYECDFGQGFGGEQGGKRPVLILQNNRGNQYSGTTIVAPLTTSDKKAWLPTHVKVKGYKESMALLEQVRVVDKSRLKRKIREATVTEMFDVDEALKISLGV